MSSCARGGVGCPRGNRPELQLVVYLAEPHSPDAEALALLGTLHATRQHSPDTSS